MGEVRRLEDARRRRHESPELCDPPPVAGRVPPHDLDAEAAVLSAVLLDRGALDVVLEIIKPEHFYSEANARIYQAAQALAVASTPIDIVSVATWLRDREWLAKMGGTAYLAQLADATPAVGHVGAHAEVVLEKWERRQVIATCQRVSAEGYGDVGEWAPYKANLRAHFGQLTMPRAKLVGAPMGAIVQQVRDTLDASSREKVPTGLAWPFGLLDGFGLMQQQTQEIITGRPGMGKTGFTFQVTRRIVEAEPVQGVGEAVYWWCGEMEPHLLVMREAANHCGLRFNDVIGFRLNADQWQRFSRTLERFQSLPIWWDHEPATPAQLAARVREVKALFETGRARREAGPGEVAGRLFPKCRMRVVAIDQLSELRPPEGMSPRADKREVVGATAKAVRSEIAVRLNVATLLLAQLNRPKDPKNVDLPALTDLRESGMIEESADGVTAIHRRQYYQRNRTSEEWRNVAEILKLKGRYGEADDVRLGFYLGRFSDTLPPAARGEPHYEGDNDNFQGDDE